MQLTNDQFALIKQQFATLKERSAFYAAKFDGIDLTDVQTQEDFEKLPFSEKDDLRNAYPLGLQAVPDEEIVRIHSSSGTTGTPVIIPYTQQDVTDWAVQFARCYETAGITNRDRIHITPGYGLWTAGIGFQLGAERLGAMTIPMGPGNTEKQLRMMQDLKSTVLCATSSYALLLAEEIAERGIRDRICLRKGVIGSERWGDKMRQRIAGELGVEIYDIYGLTEVYGPGIGISCDEHHGMHIWDDYVYVEVIDPDTGAPVPDGEVGELVLTTLRQQGAPLPHARPHAHHSGRLHVRLRPSPPAHRHADRPHRRHVQGEGLQHLPRPGGGSHRRHRRHVQRVPGDDREHQRQGCAHRAVRNPAARRGEGARRGGAGPHLQGEVRLHPRCQGRPHGRAAPQREENEAHLRQPVLRKSAQPMRLTLAERVQRGRSTLPPYIAGFCS